MNWYEIILTVIATTIIFVLLDITHVSTTPRIIIFSVSLLVILSLVKMVPPNQNTEGFFFEVSPYKKCPCKGFYGRPLNFDYQLPECETQCVK